MSLALTVEVEATASANAEAIKLRTVAEAQAEAIELVNAAMAKGGQNYLALRQLEMVPIIAPFIADALAKARLVTISSDGSGAANGATDQITSVIQTVLAAQMVSGVLKPEIELEPTKPAAEKPRETTSPEPAKPSPKPTPRIDIVPPVQKPN